jgi:hypothetical protein
MAGVTYSLIFQNQSTNQGSGCVYQEDPNLGLPNVLSLAWFSKVAAPNTNITFSWTIDYSFVWAETGLLIPGVMFMAGQTFPADLSTTNSITLSNLGGAYQFQNQGPGPGAGSLYIREDNTVPLKMASVGIGMSGAGTFVVQAQPNYNLIFTPHPKYYITFGSFAKGQVMDTTSVTNKAEIAFPPNVTSMTAILQADNSWKVAPTSSMNARYVSARQGGQIDQTARKPEKAAWGVD